MGVDVTEKGERENHCSHISYHNGDCNKNETEKMIRTKNRIATKVY